MNTKILMTVSSIFLGLMGIFALFAPNEFLSIFAVLLANPLPVQLLGALYLASALTNWTAKDSTIGGVYARPTSLGNFAHFMIGALVLLKYQLTGGTVLTWVALAVYAVFAAIFGWLIFIYGGIATQKEN